MKVACRVIISKGNTVLLGKRSQGIESEKWNIFGGKPGEGETLKEAAQREVFEEIGLYFSNLTFLFSDQFNGWTSYYFTVMFERQTLDNLTEHSEVDFFSWEQLQVMEDQIAFNHYLVLKKYFNL